MFIKNDEYKKLINDFLINRHGQIIKLSDNKGKIFCYFLRCEAIPGNKNKIICSMIADAFYSKLKFYGLITPRMLKFFGIKRLIEKWEKSKNIISYNDIISESFKDDLKNEFKNLEIMYNDLCNEKEKFDLNELTDYVYSLIKDGLKKYYKNCDEIDLFFV